MAGDTVCRLLQIQTSVLWRLMTVMLMPIARTQIPDSLVTVSRGTEEMARRAQQSTPASMHPVQLTPGARLPVTQLHASASKEPTSMRTGACLTARMACLVVTEEPAKDMNLNTCFGVQMELIYRVLICMVKKLIHGVMELKIVAITATRKTAKISGIVDKPDTLWISRIHYFE